MKLLPKLLLVLLLCIPLRMFANYINGGELYIQGVSDSTYKFILKLQWNCVTGIPEPTSMPLCFYNSCTSTYLSATMTKNAGYVELPTGCQVYPTICTSTSSNISGTKTLTYSADITMPIRCPFWRVSTYYNHRNISANCPNNVFYAEVYINNTTSNNHASAQSNNAALLYLRQNLPYTYTLDISDANGDSVVIETATPMYPNNITSCSYTPMSTSLSTKTPSLNITNNPFQTNNTFKIDNTLKAITFTPTETGAQLLDLNIKEYRTGTLISSHYKEIRFAVMPPTSYLYNISRSYGATTNCVRTADTITVCAGQAFSFNTYMKSTSAASALHVNDNHFYGATSANVSYNNQNKDSVSALFQWTAPAKPGINLVVFSVADSTCNTSGPGVITVQTFPVYINVVGKPLALKDTTICAGSNYQLKATLGGNYIWSVLPGGTAGSLSCTTCASPIATPATTTSYEVTSLASALCSNNKDTVTITVEPNKTASISLAPATVYYKPGIPVTLTATGNGCNTPSYVWKKNGTVIAGATGTTYTYTPTALDNITCEMTCTDLCTSPKLVSATRTLQWNVGIANTTTNMQVAIYPNPSNGSFEISGYSPTNNNIQYTITNPAGQTILKGNYAVKAGSYKHTLKTNLPAGVYILKLQDDNSSVVQKLIIQ